MIARYEPRICKRVAQPGEVVRLVYGCTPAGLGSGEVVDYAEFQDRTGETIELPNGAEISRLFRNYQIQREVSEAHKPTAEFPVSLVQDPFLETILFLDSKGKSRDPSYFPNRARFILKNPNPDPTNFRFFF